MCSPGRKESILNIADWKEKKDCWRLGYWDSGQGQEDNQDNQDKDDNQDNQDNQDEEDNVIFIHNKELSYSEDNCTISLQYPIEYICSGSTRTFKNSCNIEMRLKYEKVVNRI